MPLLIVSFAKRIVLLIAVYFMAVSFSYAAIEVVDAADKTHTFQQPVQRIIALTPHIAELLFSAGAGKQVVGVVEYSDFPEEVKKIPQIGGYGRFNIEAIMALEPDLVVYWPGGNAERDLVVVRKMGIPMFASNPQTFDDIAIELERFGLITGHAEQTRLVVEVFRQQVAELQQANQTKPKVSVFYQVWNSPMMSQNGQSFITRVIELCGGINIFADLPMLSPQVSVEAVLAADPDIVLAGSHQGQEPEWLADWKKYPMLKAVKTKQLRTVEADLIHRPTLRLLLAAQQMCSVFDQARAAQ